MDTAKEKKMIFEYISKNGLRNTWQRKIVLEAFLSAPKHVTAEDLHTIVKKHDHSIGSATVYRNLKLMCESGLVEKVKIGSQKARYELKFGRDYHHHLICQKCGIIAEVKSKQIEKLQDDLAQAKGFTSQWHKLEIYGLCAKCK